MKVSFNWLQSKFDSKLPNPRQLADVFTLHVFEVEEIEEKGNDTILEVKVLPDRAHYLLSHQGIAREISVLTDAVLNATSERSKGEEVPFLSDRSSMPIQLDSGSLCRRYIAQEIKDVVVQPSPEWLRSRLEAIGQKSINTIVDAANYVMFDVGQPLHIFDADKVRGNIVVRNAREGEVITILTGEEKLLKATDLVIADDQGVLAIAGVKGGKRAEVSSITKRIIIESANFDPKVVRRTATRLNLRNDSSKRFENEITPALAPEGMVNMIRLVTETIPTATLGWSQDVYPKPVQSWEVVVQPDYIAAMIGVPVQAADIEMILKKMGCMVVVVSETLSITPPLDRIDISIPEDVADEVGRVMGYEKLPAQLLPVLEQKLAPDKVFSYAEKVKDFLLTRGYSEVLSYSLVSKGEYEVTYPLASDKSFLRENLVSKAKDALIFNGRNADLLSLETIKIFEIGKVFRVDGEKTMLAMGVLQVKKKKEMTSEKILIHDFEFLKNSMNLSVDSEIILGEFGAVIEIDFDECIKNLPIYESLTQLEFVPLPKDATYQKFSSYPFIVRDVAVFVPEQTDERQIQEIIDTHTRPLCIKSRIFDVFIKDFPEGRKKSVAYRLVFQSFSKTLEDIEVNDVMTNLYAKISEQTGWQIR